MRVSWRLRQTLGLSQAIIGPNRRRFDAEFGNRAHRADTSDPAVALTSPAGTPGILNTPFNQLLNGDPALRGWQSISNAFHGEPPNGTWTLRVLDLAPGDTGCVASWRLRFHYGDHR